MSEQYKFLNPEGHLTRARLQTSLEGGERVRAHFPILNLIFIF